MITASTVTESANFIQQHSEMVSVNRNHIQSAAMTVISLLNNYKLENRGKSAEWIFFCDLLNFSFWSEEEYFVEYGQQRETGYKSLLLVIERAIELNPDILSPQYYANASEEELATVFKCVSGNYPHLKKRISVLKEAGTVLLERFDGSVESMIRNGKNSAIALLNILFDNFPSFRDCSDFEGKTVCFLKRAQIFIADLWYNFGGQGLGEFHDIDSITMFADYRILVHLRLLEYNNALMCKLPFLVKDSREEIEIRGCSIAAIECLKKHISEIACTTRVNSVLIDFALWDLAKTKSEELKHIPIHKTRTMFY